MFQKNGPFVDGRKKLTHGVQRHSARMKKSADGKGLHRFTPKSDHMINPGLTTRFTTHSPQNRKDSCGLVNPYEETWLNLRIKKKWVNTMLVKQGFIFPGLHQAWWAVQRSNGSGHAWGTWRPKSPSTTWRSSPDAPFRNGRGWKSMKKIGGDPESVCNSLNF